MTTYEKVILESIKRKSWLLEDVINYFCNVRLKLILKFTIFVHYSK